MWGWQDRSPGGGGPRRKTKTTTTERPRFPLCFIFLGFALRQMRYLTPLLALLPAVALANADCSIPRTELASLAALAAPDSAAPTPAPTSPVASNQLSERDPHRLYPRQSFSASTSGSVASGSSSTSVSIPASAQ